MPSAVISDRPWPPASPWAHSDRLCSMSDLIAAASPHTPITVRIILVHYFTPELLARCVQSIVRAPFLASDATAITIVDNGSETADRAAIDALPADVIRPPDNLGYAGAINLAIERDTADVYVVMNPDMEVSPNCLKPLVDAAFASRGAAGPRMFLDSEMNFALPPTEQRRVVSELIRAMAPRGGLWERTARRRWRRHARGYTAADASFTAYDLSGAMMAISRAAIDAIGPFDDGFRLYFEETDWLMRARKAGVQCAYLPNALAVHFYNRSARDEPHAPQWFAQSQARFRRKHYGLIAALAIEMLNSRIRQRSPRVCDSGEALEAAVTAAACHREKEYWLEIAPTHLGFPAAASRCLGRELPGRYAQALRLAADLGAPACRIALTDENGDEIAMSVIDQSGNEDRRA